VYGKGVSTGSESRTEGILIYELSCPQCQRTVSADGSYIGRLVKCPHCQGQFRLPAPLQETPPSTGQVESPPHAPSSVQGPLPPFHDASPTGYRFHFACVRCGSVLEANTTISGRQGRCPTCAAEFTVPAFNPSTGAVGKPVLLVPDEQDPTPMHAYAAAGARAPEIVTGPDSRQAIRCPRCSGMSAVDANNCKICGLPFTLEGIAPMRAPGEANGYAVASLVMGILGMPCGILVLPQLLAIIFGVIAHRQIGRSGFVERGRGMATAGVLLGLVSYFITAAAFFFRVYRP